MGYLSIQEAITNVLQTKALAGFSWGNSTSNPPVPGNPYYDVADAPPPPTPFIEFDVAKSNVEHNFSSPSSGSYGSYVEKFVLTFRVLSLEYNADLYGSPQSSASLYWLLDGYSDNPSVFDGQNFTCGGFVRTSWDKHADRSERDVSGQLLWNCEATYDFFMSVPYPPRPS